MKPLKIKEIAAAVGFDCCDETLIERIETDSRTISEGSLFVALRGEVFDGHKYVASALEKGAAYALVDKGDENDSRLIFCKDTEQGFLDIAGAYRDQFDVKLVGITGSVGKTTTKEMIAAVLESKFKTLKNEGNLNNRVGMPKTLFNLNDEHECAVIEMGMNQFGEISDLTRRAKPDVAVITNIGVQHIEFLGSREGILKAKMEIREGMKEGSPLILCGDDDLLGSFEDERFRIIRYGIDNKSCPITAEDVQESVGETTFTLCADGKKMPARIPTFGRHNVLNALAAYAVGKEFGMEDEEIIAALNNYVPSGMRQRVVEFKGMTIVEDCYNCGPDSLKAAISAFAIMPCEGRKIMVLGDMLELGDYANQLHAECGQWAAEKGVDHVFCCGELSKHTYQGFLEKGGKSAVHHLKRDDMGEQILSEIKNKNIKAGDILWFKASHGVHLEDIIKRIYEEC